MYVENHSRVQKSYSSYCKFHSAPHFINTVSLTDMNTLMAKAFYIRKAHLSSWKVLKIRNISCGILSLYVFMSAFTIFLNFCSSNF